MATDKHPFADDLDLPDLKVGQDAHKAMAARIFGVPYDQVTPEQRRLGKVRNYGLLYVPDRIPTQGEPDAPNP